MPNVIMLDPPSVLLTAPNAGSIINIPPWAASTAYSVGFVVIGPDGTCYSCVIQHTSGLTFTASPNWTVVGLGNNGTGYVLSTIGTGASNNLLVATGTTSGQYQDTKIGTLAAPDTSLNPIFKQSRTIELLSSNIPGGGDGGENATAIHGIVAGTAANQVQTVGVTGGASNQGTALGASGSPDACAIYGVGRILGSGIGVAIGGFFISYATTSTSKGSAIQANNYNGTGVDHTVNVTGFPTTCVVWLTQNGTNKTGAGLVFGNPFNFQVDAGIHWNAQVGAGGSRVDAGCVTVNANATVTDAAALATDVGRVVTGTNIPANSVILTVVPSTSFTMNNNATGAGTVSLTLAKTGPTASWDMLTDSAAPYGYLIRGTHSTAALSVASGSGAILIGETALTNANALLEIASSITRDPVMAIRATNASALSFVLTNTAAGHRMFVAGGPNNFLTGTVSGDTGIEMGTSNAFHIGYPGATAILKITNGALTGNGASSLLKNFQRQMRKATTAAVTPSATINTLGASVSITPASGFYGMEVNQVRVVSGGTFGAETLTYNVTFTFSDASTQFFQGTFTAAGVTFDFANGNILVNAYKDGLALTSVSFNCQSSIASSLASFTGTVAALNT